jgi:hypothetical protein
MNNYLKGWTKEVTVRQVKEIYLLARRLSDRPFDNEGFYAIVDSGQRELGTLTDSAIDETIRQRDGNHESRARRFSAARWEIAIVELTACCVWPSGDRKGRVDQVAQYMAEHEGAKVRVAEIPRVAHLLLLSLPIIVLRRNDNPFCFNIDDGVHRSAAYYRMGLGAVPAFIGTIPAELNHSWPCSW